MATNKNITMRQFNGTDYDTLYPKTIAEQVDGIYNKDEVLSNSTKALYGLPDMTVPDEVFALLKTLVNDAQERANISAKFEVGSYQGAYNHNVNCSKTIYFTGKPQIVIIVSNNDRGLMPSGPEGWNTKYGAIICRGQTGIYNPNLTQNNGIIGISFSDNSITIGPARGDYVLNYNYYTYSYFALCT